MDMLLTDICKAQHRPLPSVEQFRTAIKAQLLTDQERLTWPRLPNVEHTYLTYRCDLLHAVLSSTESVEVLHQRIVLILRDLHTRWPEKDIEWIRLNPELTNGPYLLGMPCSGGSCRPIECTTAGYSPMVFGESEQRDMMEVIRGYQS